MVGSIEPDITMNVRKGSLESGRSENELTTENAMTMTSTVQKIKFQIALSIVKIICFFYQ